MGNEQVVCFKVSNFKGAYKKDNFAIEKAERELARAGALPAKIHETSKLFCVTLTNPKVLIKNIQKILKK